MSEAEVSLGKLAMETGHRVRSSGWQQVVSELRGSSNISVGVHNLPHKASRLLDHLRRRGAAVPMTSPPWSIDEKGQAMARGPHQSSHGERDFVAREMLDFCRQGYWLVVPYSVVKDWPNLRISPLGVVPQRDRRPRLIVDYTFSSVNQPVYTSVGASRGNAVWTCPAAGPQQNCARRPSLRPRLHGNDRHCRWVLSGLGPDR